MRRTLPPERNAYPGLLSGTLPAIDRALMAPALVFPENDDHGYSYLEHGDVVETLGETLLNAARKKPPAFRLEACRRTWKLARLFSENDNLQALEAATHLGFQTQDVLLKMLRQGELSPEQRQQLRAFLTAHRLQPEAMVRAGDNAILELERPGCMAAPSNFRGRLYTLYRGRERRLWLSYYARQRSCLVDQADPLRRGLVIDRDRDALIARGDEGAGYALIDFRMDALPYRLVLDRQDLILAALGEPIISPRVRREGQKLILDDPDQQQHFEVPRE